MTDCSEDVLPSGWDGHQLLIAGVEDAPPPVGAWAEAGLLRGEQTFPDLGSELIRVDFGRSLIVKRHGALLPVKTDRSAHRTGSHRFRRLARLP